VFEELMESSLLPILENNMRGATMIDMAKDCELYHSYFALIRAMASQ
jgi:hypothetical protein